MLSDFFRINLPYGIARNTNNEWMAFNREYLPLGYNDFKLKGNPEENYLNLPVYSKYKRISEQFLLKLVDGEAEIHRNELGEIVKVFLYSDSTNPVNQTSEKKHLWDMYFDKLKKLSKLQVV